MTVSNANSVISAVTENLRTYADRGLFRNFSVFQTPRSVQCSGRTDYQFNWLTDSTVNMRLDALKGRLQLIDILPGVAYRSAMDKSLRAFVIGRCNPALPGHRRIDTEKVSLKLTNRQQKVSIALDFQAADAAQAAKTAIQLLHEIFNNFLQEGPYHNYMLEHFNEPED